MILDNIDLMEAFIDQLAQMRAVAEVDRVISASYNSRRLHKEVKRNLKLKLLT